MTDEPDDATRVARRGVPDAPEQGEGTQISSRRRGEAAPSEDGATRASARRRRENPDPDDGSTVVVRRESKRRADAAAAAPDDDTVDDTVIAPGRLRATAKTPFPVRPDDRDPDASVVVRAPATIEAAMVPRAPAGQRVAQPVVDTARIDTLARARARRRFVTLVAGAAVTVALAVLALTVLIAAG